MRSPNGGSRSDPMDGPIRARPSLWLTLAYALGLFAIECPWLLVVVLAFAAWLGKRRGLLAVATFFAGWMVASKIPNLILDEREFFGGVATVETVSRPSVGREWVVARVPWGRLLVALPKGALVAPGDVLEGRGVVEPLNEAEQQSWSKRGVVGRWKPYGPLRWSRSGSEAVRSAVALRRSFVGFTSRALGPGLAESVDALLFNVRGELSKEFQRDLRLTGTVHIVSASGLHAAVVAFAVLGVMALLPVPRTWQLALAGLALAGYAAAAGLQAPIVRSVALVLGLQTAYLWRREPDAVGVTSFTALAFLIAEPWLAWDLGFQLSFATVVGLAMFGGTWPSGETLMERAKTSLLSLGRASLVASAVSAPLVAYHFGQVPLLSVVSNLLIAFSVGPVVVGSLAAAALAGVLPETALAAMRLLVAPMTEWLVGVVDWLGAWEATAPRMPEFGGGWLLLVYAAMLALWREDPKPCDSIPE